MVRSLAPWLVALVLAGCGGDDDPAPSVRAVTAPTVVVSVYFPRGDPGTSCTRVSARRRSIRPPAVLHGAIAALLRGPTRAERARGFGGWFSARTAGRLRSVSIRSGTARVDLRDLRRVIPNASTSCGSALLLAQLDRTARQFPSVRRTVYSFDGDVRAFYEWLQRPAPAPSDQ